MNQLQEDILSQIPKTFADDGCTRAPDKIFRWDLGWCCRIHDWRYCSRCHTPGTMDTQRRNLADEELRTNLRSVLPWRWRWIGWAYWIAVWRYGGFEAWDSCGPSVGAICHHNVPLPDWMSQ